VNATDFTRDAISTLFSHTARRYEGDTMLTVEWRGSDRTLYIRTRSVLAHQLRASILDAQCRQGVAATDELLELAALCNALELP
jgi:hypothetical protein